MSSSPNQALLPFDYRVVRSKRKSAAIQINADAVLVRVPQWVSAQWVDDFVQSRREWVLRHLDRQQIQQAAHGIEIVQAGLIPWRGRDYRLSWARGAASGVRVQGDELQVTLSRRIRRPEAEATGTLVQQWLIQQATQQLVPRLQELGRQSGLVPAGVSIRNFRRRWGSCDSQGRIALNWRLIMARPDAADYVLIHELCHLRHFDHSPRFWALVEQHCPNYRSLQAYFHQRGCWLQW
ncbi:M48 family metallopeptidase [Marinobacterium rhizophilum]|uniref:M48 family metallopeptidase n=1 Tax=Marinobacterium rhizophilum TaxID=420402 RepID=A0ABY5HP42_9GAMM|nr:SprT family zinc-dependent metalloprotease [Marinobacterium rhizophilum]UTW12666.1 M48 family metallopeptidase [Marinobacterium rhizophilum]